MRASLALIALAACGGSGHSIPDPIIVTPESAPTKPPPTAASDPAPKVDGDVTEAWVHGVHVLVKRIPGAETAATQLYVLGGARTWTNDTAGLELLSIRTAVEGGTERQPRDVFTRRLSELGSTIYAGTADDFTVVSAWSLAPAWDETFGMLADAFRRPALPAAQLEIVRARQLANLRHEQESPDSRLVLAMIHGVFHGHAYERRPAGTLATVPAFTGEQVRAQLASLRDASRMLLVVVGDIDPARVVAATKQAFGDLPRSEHPLVVMPELAPFRAGAVTTVADKLPTNYIFAVAPGPGWHSGDYATAVLAMQVLHDREFKEVRTKRNLSYAPSAFFSRDRDTTLVGLYVTAVDPGETLKVMYDEASRLRTEGVPDAELLGAKSTLLTDVFMGGEAAGDQASQLALAQIHGGDWHLVRTLPERVRAVTAAQVTAWAAKYLARFQVFVVGDDAKVDRAMIEKF